MNGTRVQQSQTVEVDEEIIDPLVNYKDSLGSYETTQPNLQLESFNSDNEIGWEDRINESGVRQSPPVKVNEDIDDPILE